MPDEQFPAFIRGLYFPDGESHHRFLNDMDAGLCDPDEVETWLAWPDPPPLPEIMTAEQACRYLRLDIGRSMALALKALNRLVDEKRLLHPAMYRKQRMYTKAECDRCMAELAEKR